MSVISLSSLIVVVQASEAVRLELLAVPEGSASALPPAEQAAVEAGDRWPLLSSEDARAVCDGLKAGINTGLRSLPDALLGA